MSEINKTLNKINSAVNCPWFKIASFRQI